MANYEVDPMLWLPHGHQIIDGGPTRLPRTFYSPSVDPPRRHDNICVAELLPPPPAPLILHWRQQVRNFIEDHLQCIVEEVQPCLLGLAFYRLRSPAATAALVNHVPYQIQQGFFVRFLNHDDRDNHRAVQGFRNGWLMFLSIPLDFRTDYDLANAISSFGKLLHWHQDDALLERTICYVAFSSEATVPRDVVFTKFASVGGIKESWTAVCYILTAEFADALPNDEDQMPVNGNPHPLPGQLLPNLNNFVLPQFPEIGCNDPMQMNIPEQVQPLEQGFQHPHIFLDQDQDNDQDQVMDVQGELQQLDNVLQQQVEHEIQLFNESAVIDSSSSEGSVNMMQGPQQMIVNTIELQFSVLDKDLISFLVRQYPSYKNCMDGLIIGPILPKDILFDKISKDLIPSLFMHTIPAAVPVNKLAWLKYSLQCSNDNFRLQNNCFMVPADMTPVARKGATRKGKKVIPPSSRVTRSALKAQVSIQKHTWRNKDKRSSAGVSLFTDSVDSSDWTESSVRRCTRHMAKTGGYKFESMKDKSTARKKAQASKPDEAEEEVVPFIPVPTLQHIGRQLQISEEELTEERLMATSDDFKGTTSTSNDD
ncbi:hypothetical protein QYE76_058052 [Lolium multiflorum]|uniref:DUF7597 domain-containing protein n=1 Tax=Lolium multiflorum TaxID=4521 RepID=A0AAD8WR80_LOLMU|nr:hypothetical protein QYE76_058052 [Lolium multiflorum]